VNDNYARTTFQTDDVMVQMLGPHLRSEVNSTETLCEEVIYSYRHLKTIFITVVLELPPSVAICIRLGDIEDTTCRFVIVSCRSVENMSVACLARRL